MRGYGLFFDYLVMIEGFLFIVVSVKVSGYMFRERLGEKGYSG